MAASGGIQFLQSNVEDGPKALGTYKAGNTEVIRKMLREQQRECQQLHANPLFKEFRVHPGSIQQKKFGKGYVVEEAAGVPPQLTDPKGLEYEGQARMFDLIKNTAIKEEKARQGVWASFGAPYVPLGDPRELAKTLPELNRDKMSSREGQRLGRRKPPAKSAAASPDPQQRTRGPAARGGRGAAAPDPVHSDDESQIGVPSLHGGDDDPEQITVGEAAIRAATREAEDTLNKHKSVMRFNVMDRTEAVFPAAVLRNAEGRARKAKASAGAFVNAREAEAELCDPRRAYGQPPLPAKRHLAPLSGRRGSGGPEEGGEGSTFFLTQAGQGAGAEALHDDRSMDLLGSSSMLPGSRHDLSSGSMGGSPFGNMRAGGDASYVPLVEPVVALRGDEANPVYRWHNDFVAVRQAGRAQLQAHLYARAQGRANARTDPTSAAAMSTTLFGVLNLSQGRMPTYASGGKLVSPYTRSDAYKAAQEAARRNTKQKAVQALEPAEIRILQRFYDQLCALVEAQRMSDPLCLMVVSKVKSLLEAGVYLHRPMLVAVVEHVAEFARGAGMMRYNKYLLAVLTFIAKCVGLEVADLEDVVEAHGVSIVVYGTAVPPSKCTAEQVAALGAEEGDASGPFAGHAAAAAAAAAAGPRAGSSEQRIGAGGGGRGAGAAGGKGGGGAGGAADGLVNTRSGRGSGLVAGGMGGGSAKGLGAGSAAAQGGSPGGEAQGGGAGGDGAPQGPALSTQERLDSLVGAISGMGLGNG